MALQRQADDYFMGKREAAKEASSLTELDAMITQLLGYKDNICRRMEVMTADSHPELLKENAPAGMSTLKPKKITSIRRYDLCTVKRLQSMSTLKPKKITSIRRYDLCTVKRLQSKEDIDKYVEGIREKLLKTLENCDSIQIN